MSHLLDTRVLLFFFNDEDRLTSVARTILADRSNPIFVSAVSLYEIGLTVAAETAAPNQPLSRSDP